MTIALEGYQLWVKEQLHLASIDRCWQLNYERAAVWGKKPLRLKPKQLFDPDHRRGGPVSKEEIEAIRRLPLTLPPLAERRRRMATQADAKNL